MFSRTIHRGFQHAMGLVVPLVLIPLLVVPLPALAAMTQPSVTPAAKTATPAGASEQAKAADRFCANSDCTKTRETFRRICDFTVKEKSNYPTIYIGGYYMRDLVAGYEIFGDRKYLDTTIAYADYLLKKQMPNGFWPTGYGPVYMADTGSAVGLLAVLYKHVDAARQKKYFDAIKLYTDSIQKDGMILPSGAFGSGWANVKNGKLVDPDYTPYTLSSVLTGATVFTWMYRMTKRDKYRRIAYRALQWVFSTMKSNGSILDTFPDGGENPAMTAYGTAAYVGEGVIAFALHCDNPEWQGWIGRRVRPNIEFLLRNQLPNGTWSRHPGLKDWDRTRSPGIVNYLIWYYDHVDPDPRIQKAVQRYDAYVTNSQTGKAYGLLIDGASNPGKGKELNPMNALTSMTGRALADILKPGVDVAW